MLGRFSKTNSSNINVLFAYPSEYGKNRGRSEIDPMASIHSNKAIESLLASDHAALDRAFDALVRAIDEDDAGQALARLDFLWARLAVHIRAEHLCLFPAILHVLADERGKHETAVDSDTAREGIAQLKSDHDFFMGEMARAMAILRATQSAENNQPKAWQDDVRQMMFAIRHRLEMHNAMEEEKVYRWASMLLDSPDQDALATRVTHELQNLPPRFKEN